MLNGDVRAMDDLEHLPSPASALQIGLIKMRTRRLLSVR